MLKQRVITAVTLVMMLGLAFYFLSLASLKLLVIAIIVLASKEWAKLSLVKSEVQQWLYALTIGFVAYFCEMMITATIQTLYLQIISLCWLVTIVYLLFVIKKISTQKNISFVWLIVGGMVLLATYLSLTTLLEKFDHNRLLILMLVAVVWVTDSGAYFVGKTIGKHKFAPVVSPGKTWQGVFGGVILASIYAYFIAPSFTNSNTLFFVLLITFAAWVSVFGDLLESWLKRQSGFKDSGKILPGHGGILDRVDSLLSYTPVIVVGLAYV